MNKTEYEAKSISENYFKRCVIFAHFDKHDLIDDYVLFYLNKLSEISSAVIFISTSNLSSNSIKQLEDICLKVIVRENIGYDFMSWRVGMNFIPNMEDYDELILCNDSVYGPFFNLKDIFIIMQSRDCDFWGLTESQAIAYHLQSYFLVFRKKVLSSVQFNNFWNSVFPLPSKQHIIINYEVGLTQTLLAAGFTSSSYISHHPSTWFFTKKISLIYALKNPHKIFHFFIKILKYILGNREIFDPRRVNVTHIAWEELIVQKKMPFLKIELLRDNPFHLRNKNYGAVLKENTDYNPDLIDKHLKRIKSID